MKCNRLQKILYMTKNNNKIYFLVEKLNYLAIYAKIMLVIRNETFKTFRNRGNYK